MIRIVVVLGGILFMISGFFYFFKNYLSQAIDQVKQAQPTPQTKEVKVEAPLLTDKTKSIIFKFNSIEAKGSMNNVVVVSFELSNESDNDISEDFIIQCGELKKEFKSVLVKQKSKSSYKDIVLRIGQPSECVKVPFKISEVRDVSQTSPQQQTSGLPAPKL